MSKVAKAPKDRCVVCGDFIRKGSIVCRECLSTVVSVTVTEHDRRPYSDGTLERSEGRIRRSER